MYILHTESSLGWGGQELRILTESLGMIRRGHQVRLLCPSEATLFKAAQERNIPVTALPIARKNFRGLLALKRWLGGHQADVLVTHSSTDSWLASVAACLIPHPPPLVRLRHLSAAVPKNLPTRWLYTRGCCRIVTSGESIRQQLIQDNHFDPARIVSIPTGIDLAHFTPGNREVAKKQLGLPISDLVIGIVATLRSWKGHDHLLEAFFQINRPNLRLLIVGDGPRNEHIKRIIAQKPDNNRVIMAGNHKDVVPWLQAMDLFILPSYANEGVPQALMQAMACGLPVISTPVGSIPEIVCHGETGFLTPPKDSAMLAKAIEILLDQPHRRTDLGQAALHLARTRFSLETTLDRMEQVFQDCAAL